MRNLVYFSPVTSEAIGGIKVFYRHTERINQLGQNAWGAQVFHWEQPDFSCSWFEHRARMRADSTFDAAADFVILPECHLQSFWQQLADARLGYAIFVQNGYLIGANSGIAPEQLLLAYQKASLILVISDDSADCVRLWVPECAHKIVRVHFSIPPELFHPSDQKENLITFMPRKMADHSQLVTLFLQRALPAGWKIVPIHGMTEAEVAATLRRSRIFMSFCALEGLAMPPAEAALCGNHVVGYTGQGGREYWEPGLFTEVPMGDIRGFVREVLGLVARLDIRRDLGLAHLTEEARVAVELVKARFSVEQEAAGLRRLLSRVDEVGLHGAAV